MISVSRLGDSKVHDIEVPAGMRAGEMASLIAQAMGWSCDAAGRRVRYRVEVHPLGRVLAEAETLADAGVWDGAWLVLQPLAESEPAVTPARDQPAFTGDPHTPVVRWRSLRPLDGGTGRE